jgi:hypothetical protein
LDGGDGGSEVRHADIRASLADGRQTGADRELASDERRAPSRATGFPVVIGEQHAFGGKLVQVWCSPGNHAR